MERWVWRLSVAGWLMAGAGCQTDALRVTGEVPDPERLAERSGRKAELPPLVPRGKIDGVRLKVQGATLVPIRSADGAQVYGLRVTPSADPQRDFLEVAVCPAGRSDGCQPSREEPAELTGRDISLYELPTGRIEVHLRACVRAAVAKDAKTPCGPWKSLPYFQEPLTRDKRQQQLQQATAAEQRFSDQCQAFHRDMTEYRQRAATDQETILKLVDRNIEVGPDRLCAVVQSGITDEMAEREADEAYIRDLIKAHDEAMAAMRRRKAAREWAGWALLTAGTIGTAASLRVLHSRYTVVRADQVDAWNAGTWRQRFDWFVAGGDVGSAKVGFQARVPVAIFALGASLTAIVASAVVKFTLADSPEAWLGRRLQHHQAAFARLRALRTRLLAQSSTNH